MKSSILLWLLEAHILINVAMIFPQIEGSEPACAYEDSVDISGSTVLPNGDHLFQGYKIPKNLTYFYDYDVLYQNEMVSVPRHLRGCICLVTNCIKLCCNPKETKVRQSRECTEELSDELNYSPYYNITNEYGKTNERHIFNEMFIQQHLPCEIGYTLREGEGHVWELLENGTLRLFNEEFTLQLSKNDYCLTPEKLNDQYLLAPLICLPSLSEPGNLRMNFIIMTISIPLMITTIFVYALIRELRNLHGKCLIAYLIAMTFGDILLNTNNFCGIVQIEITDSFCRIMGYSGYYFIIAAFFWLSIISFDLWHNFRGTSNRVLRLVQQKRFYVYSVFGWLVPGVCTALTIGSQLSNLHPDLKPGIGEEFCLINVTKWSAMIYFYGPIMIILLFNSTMFILTFMKIYRVQRELSRFAEKKENNRHLGCDRDDFGMFLRLFVVMGVNWVFEVLSFFNPDNIIFQVTDCLNSAMGIIIFALFVLKRRVRLLILKRLHHSDNTEYDLEYSSRSDCEPEEICMRNYNKDGTLLFLK